MWFSQVLNMVFIIQTTCINKSWDLLNEWRKYSIKIHADTFENDPWEFLVVQWLGLGAFTAGFWLQFWLGELRFCKPCGAAKKKKKKDPCHCLWCRCSCIRSLDSRHPPRIGTDLTALAQWEAEPFLSFLRPGVRAGISPTTCSPFATISPSLLVVLSIWCRFIAQEFLSRILPYIYNFCLFPIGCMFESTLTYLWESWLTQISEPYAQPEYSVVLVFGLLGGGYVEWGSTHIRGKKMRSN